MALSNVKGLPWAPSGRKIVDVRDCKTSEEVMIKAGLNFNVTKCPIVAEMPFHMQDTSKMVVDHFVHDTNIYADISGFYATYREDAMIPLGLVKSKYEPVQNIDAFRFFDDAIGEGQAIWQTAGSFGFGERIFVTAKLPFNVDASGGDMIDTYLVFTNSHDGSHGVDILFTPIRVVCQNTLNAAIRTAECHVRFKHTQSVHGKINEAKDIMGISAAKAKYAEELYKMMRTISMTDDEVLRYIASCHLSEGELALIDKIDPNKGINRLFYREFNLLDEAKISTRKANICANTLEWYLDGVGQQNIRGTAWGAYNAITGYYSNVANLEGEKRIDSLLYGNAANVTGKAMELALQAA